MSLSVDEAVKIIEKIGEHLLSNEESANKLKKAADEDKEGVKDKMTEVNDSLSLSPSLIVSDIREFTRKSKKVILHSKEDLIVPLSSVKPSLKSR